MMRKHLLAPLTQREALIEASIARFRAEFPQEDSVVGLAAVERDSVGSWARQTALFPQAIERRRDLVLRNGDLGSLAKRHVSSEPR
jgi:hypothetical protein